MPAGYGAHLQSGDSVVARDDHGRWGDAVVKEVEQDGASSGRRLRVHFCGFSSRHDEWIKVGSGRLRPAEGARSSYGEEAVGRRVRVQWDTGIWYAGVLARFNDQSQRHRVVFDDGDVQWYRIDHEEGAGLLQWLDGDGAEGADDCLPAAHLTLDAPALASTCNASPSARPRARATGRTRGRARASVAGRARASATGRARANARASAAVAAQAADAVRAMMEAVDGAKEAEERAGGDDSITVV